VYIKKLAPKAFYKSKTLFQCIQHFAGIFHHFSGHHRGIITFVLLKINYNLPFQLFSAWLKTLGAPPLFGGVKMENFAAMHFRCAVMVVPHSEAGISKNYCTTNSGSPEVELRFCSIGSYCSNIELDGLT
jgi:hypothetical protein